MVVGYGKKIRKKYDASRKKSQAKYDCPSCSRQSVRRKSHGVWECSKCSAKFASGAYDFER